MRTQSRFRLSGFLCFFVACLSFADTCCNQPHCIGRRACKCFSGYHRVSLKRGLLVTRLATLILSVLVRSLLLVRSHFARLRGGCGPPRSCGRWQRADDCSRARWRATVHGCFAGQASRRESSGRSVPPLRGGICRSAAVARSARRVSAGGGGRCAAAAAWPTSAADSGRARCTHCEESWSIAALETRTAERASSSARATWTVGGPNRRRCEHSAPGWGSRICICAASSRTAGGRGDRELAVACTHARFAGLARWTRRSHVSALPWVQL